MAALRRSGRRGQSTVEFALLFGTVIVPTIFGIIYVAQLLWIWHSMVEFTRDGARYAATHCATDGSNVISYMQSNVPGNVDQTEFQSGGNAQISVQYFQSDPSNPGGLVAFACVSGSLCEPDAVTVSINNYQFQHYVDLLKSVTMPPFPSSQAMGGAGYDQLNSGVCTP